MSKQRVIKDLASWKAIYVTWRNVCEKAEPGFRMWANRYCNAAKRVVQRIEARILVCLVLGLLIGGCHTINGVGRDLSAWSSPYIEHQEK